jgi:hypothetical protein
MKFRVFWDVAPCSLVGVDRVIAIISLMMKAVRTSETSVDFNVTTSQNTLNFILDSVRTLNLTDRTELLSFST